MHKPELPKLRIPGKSSSSDVQMTERWSSFDAGRWHRGRGLQAEVAPEKQQEEEQAAAACRDEAHLGHFGRACMFVRTAIAFLLCWNSHHHIKRVDASLQVLKTYHKSLLYGDVPLGGRIRTVIRRGHIGYVWYVLELNLSLLSGVLYVYSTYAMGAGLYIKRIQDFISLVFFMDYVLRILCEPATLYYVFSLRGIVELLSFVPLAFLFNGPGRGSRFIHLLQLLRIVRIFSCLGDIGIVGSTATQQIILLVVATIGVVFLDAGILQWLEAGSSSLTYWQSFYFFIVTVSTVGYGDIVPSSILGQVLAVLTIIGAIVILPSQVGKITSVASRRYLFTPYFYWKFD